MRQRWAGKTWPNLCCFWHAATIAPAPSFPFVLKPPLTIDPAPSIWQVLLLPWNIFQAAAGPGIPHLLGEWCPGGSSEGEINLSYPMFCTETKALWQLLLKQVIYPKANLPHKRWCWASMYRISTDVLIMLAAIHFIFLQCWSAIAVGI